MNFVDRINLNHLRVFEAVYRSKSMTKAAQELHLTQSGISQHIKSLEDNLGVILFDRFKQKILPTSVADVLFDRCVDSLSGLEKVLRQITATEHELLGSVRVGMPLEFGNSLLLPIVSKFLRNHPLVQVEVVFGLSHDVISEILNGNLDFAYIGDFSQDRRIAVEHISDQVITLVASAKYLKSKPPIKHQKAFYENLDFVAYLKGEPVLRSWFKFHLKSIPTLNVRAYCASPSAVLKLVQEDLGVGVVPQHMLRHLGRGASKLVILPGSGKHLLMPISVAFLEGKSHSHVAFELSKMIAEDLGVLDHAAK